MKIQLTDRGNSAYCIQLCRHPDAASVFAADELRRLIEKSSGVCLDIERNDEPRSPCIRLGNIRADKRLKALLGPERVGQMTADRHFLAQDEYFCIAVSGEDVLLAGSGDRGTCYGVYEFLERFLDCGFGARDFDANHVGETVIKRNLIEIPSGFEMVQGPHFPVRTLLTHWGPHGPYAALWGLRQRCNVVELYPEQLPEAVRGTGLVPQGHHHKFFKTIIDFALADREKRPAAFDLDAVRRVRADGSRIPREDWTRPESGGNLFCFSAPATVEFFAAGIKEYVRQNPGVKIVQLTVPDGGFYNYAERGGEYAADACFCPACQGEIKLIQAQRRRGRYADWGGFVLKFRNAVMEKVAAEYPDLRAVSLAYINYSANPDGVCPHPNLLIWYTMDQGEWWEYGGERTRQPLERLEQWVKAAADPRQITIWNAEARRDGFYGGGAVFQEEAPLYRKLNLGGGNIRPGMPYSYFRARMLWNPLVPQARMEEDFVRWNYHAAAPVMREVLAKMEGKMRDGKWINASDGEKLRAEICVLLERAKALVAADADALRNVGVDEARIREATFAE